VSGVDGPTVAAAVAAAAAAAAAAANNKAALAIRQLGELVSRSFSYLAYSCC